MMVMALGPTVWIAVGDAEMPTVVEHLARPVEAIDVIEPPTITPPREMPVPAPLAMPLQQF